MAFCSLQWQRGYRGEPVLRRISWEDDRDSAPVLGRRGRPNKGSQIGSQIKRGANRAYVFARLRRDGRRDLVERVEAGSLSVRRALAALSSAAKGHAGA